MSTKQQEFWVEIMNTKRKDAHVYRQEKKRRVNAWAIRKVKCADIKAVLTVAI